MPGGMSSFNIYCDESCHLPNDGCDVMVLGAVTCPADCVRAVSKAIKGIKIKHGISPEAEVKWTKVTKSNAEFYAEIISYFFDSEFLRYRAVIAKEKSKLDHSLYPGQDHDVWYYKMYFLLLSRLLDSSHSYQILIDVKDTRGRAKIEKLHEYLSDHQLDFDRRIIKSVRTVLSHDTPILQITDLITGALSYVHRALSSNAGKNDLIDLIRRRSNKTLLKGTFLGETKFNLLVWNPRKPDADQGL